MKVKSVLVFCLIALCFQSQMIYLFIAMYDILCDNMAKSKKYMNSEPFTNLTACVPQLNLNEEANVAAVNLELLIFPYLFLFKNVIKEKWKT